MEQIWISVLTTAGTVFASLLVTFIFNKVSGLPQEIKKERNARESKINNIEENVNKLVERIEKVEEAVNRYPEYRAQSLQIQDQLRQTDVDILELCNSIKDNVNANREMLDTRLKSLESREKNALRAKILDEYRLYTDERKNPQQAWTEMEAHSFFELVKDYESLGGNDYVHKVIIPAMHELDIVKMSELDRIKNLFNSRSVN